MSYEGVKRRNSLRITAASIGLKNHAGADLGGGVCLVWSRLFDTRGAWFVLEPLHAHTRRLGVIVLVVVGRAKCSTFYFSLASVKAIPVFFFPSVLLDALRVKVTPSDIIDARLPMVEIARVLCVFGVPT